ncbi:MAG: hypothetical protein KF718_02630 [Polyangiaceae bacterium]|nr:hypothetical protein [Polyangiaceae bacterium]
MQPLVERAPDFAQPLLGWLLAPTTLGALSVGSVVLFVGSLLAMPWLVTRIPTDYFARTGSEPPPSLLKRPWARVGWRVLRNVMGGCMLLAGIAMLVLPGQGILTIVVSLMLLEFPNKRRVLRRLLARRRVRSALDSIRRRAGREPLDLGPDHPND